jgi:hypothetical protein
MSRFLAYVSVKTDRALPAPRSRLPSVMLSELCEYLTKPIKCFVAVWLIYKFGQISVTAA